MIRSRKQVTLTEFKRLLHDIRDRRPDVGIRIRLMGQMWSDAFCHVRAINEHEVLLLDAGKNKRVRITEVNDVIQFELECSFFGFHAFYHYEIIGMPVMAAQDDMH